MTEPSVSRRHRIAVVGTGYVGLSNAVILAQHNTVVALDIDPVKVDRISPDDAKAIREGGAAATLKGTQFHNFGAFFSRAYRENDYLWGRLHGADRLIDIVVSTLPAGSRLKPGRIAAIKREAFLAILKAEEERLTAIPALFEALRKEIG